MSILCGDSLAMLKTLPDASVRCCITSPPYWGLRDYGHEGQIGLERTPDEYVARIVEVFREVRRVLKDDGTLWLNLGDSYASNSHTQSTPKAYGGRFGEAGGSGRSVVETERITVRRPDGWTTGLKPKDLVGIPWRVAFALQADGWYLRQDIIWHKPNPMPESVTDRCTKAHEYVFLLTKAERYYFNAKAISERATGAGVEASGNGTADSVTVKDTRNKRSVWAITAKPFSGAHFAVMPEELALTCALAGSAHGDTILDPFSGAGTVGVVATKTGRKYVGIELNPEYVQIAERRIYEVAPLFAEVAS